MKNDAEWNPQALDLWSLCKITQVKKENRTVYNVKRDTLYTFPYSLSNHTHDVFAYSDPSSDESILTEISPSLVQLK